MDKSDNTTLSFPSSTLSNHARRYMALSDSATNIEGAERYYSKVDAKPPEISLHSDADAHRKFSPLNLELDDHRPENDEDLVDPLVHYESSEDHPSNRRHYITPAATGDDLHGGASPGSASTPQVLINVVISFVGAGLLGIPNAFSKSGWLLGSIALLTVSALNVYAMLCLPSVQVALQRRHPEETIQSYGDVGRVIMGERGEKTVFVCLGISQAGFATAYIIFIAANLKSIYNVSRGMVCMACIPGLAMLVQFRDLKSLSPFSLLANTATFSALLAVLFQDYESYTPHNDSIHKVKWEGLLYVIAITIYSMEGVGLILSLKASCKKPEGFSSLLIGTLTVISLFMVVFGSAGYWAFGDNTMAPVTLNMSSHFSATFVKIALCLGLYLTYPIMMFPIWTICENSHAMFRTSTPGHWTYRILLRASVVVTSAMVAYGVPNFGKFLSLVGSSICTLLGFVFPMYFHLYVLGKDPPLWQKSLDVFLLVGGLGFGVMGTWQSLLAMLHGKLEGGM